MYRGAKAKKKRIRDGDKINKAAITIQKVVRGWLMRAKSKRELE